MNRRSASLLALVTLVSLNACNDSPTFRLPEYPVASAPPRFTSRTVTDDNGLVYYVDDTSKCVQLAFDRDVATDCLSFDVAEQSAYQGVWRSGGEVMVVAIFGEAATTAPSGTRRIARWYTIAFDPEPDEVDAIELEPGVYAVGYRSATTVPIWGLQIRTPDGRQLHVIPIVGQFLNVPR